MIWSTKWVSTGSPSHELYMQGSAAGHTAKSHRQPVRPPARLPPSLCTLSCPAGYNATHIVLLISPDHAPYCVSLLSTSSQLGVKGARLADLHRIGLPIPPGFTVPTEACAEFHARAPVAGRRKVPSSCWEGILEGLRAIEKETGHRLGDPKAPLLLSIRSGAAVRTACSMAS